MEKLTSTNLHEHSTFGLLPESEGMNGAYAVSAILNVCLLGLFMVLSLFALHTKIVAHEHETLSLVVAQKPPEIPKPVVHTQIVPPPPELLQNIAPKIVFPHATTEEAPHMTRMKMDVPNAPVLPPYKPVDVALPPQPKVGMFQASVPTQVANNMGRASTHTGGFGDPTGARPNPNSAGSHVAAYGSFQNSVGGQAGAGSALKGSVHGVDFGSGYASGRVGGGGHGKVASTGFGNTVTTGARGPQGTVQMAGFHNNVAAATAPSVAATTNNYEQAQIFYHPKAPYTEEAKSLNIQGEVTLEVRFTADGKAEVLRVVHGLGHGLDEQAIHAAQQTRFKPATKDGHPVDMTTYMHFTFQKA